MVTRKSECAALCNTVAPTLHGSAGPRDRYPRQAGVVIMTPDVGPAVLTQQVGNLVLLPGAVLDQHHAVGFEECATACRELADGIESVLACDQRGPGFPAQCVQCFIAGLDVGRIGHDDMKGSACHGLAPVAAQEFDIRQPELTGVLFGDGECAGADISGSNSAERALARDGDRDRTAAPAFRLRKRLWLKSAR